MTIWKKVFEIKLPMQQMILLKQVLKITFITTLHHVKQQYVTVMTWQATAYHTDMSNANFINKVLANFFKIEL
jgi:hypothetical protein